MHKLLSALTTAIAATLLAACASHSELDEPDDDVWPAEPMPAENGSIYKPGQDVALFENSTARHAGDIVTIRLVEKTDAQKSSSTTTSKSTDVNLSGAVVAGRPVTVNGAEILSGGVNNEAAFDGAGDSKQSNRLQGDITVTVIRRL